jgi:hypothetical protein
MTGKLYHFPVLSQPDLLLFRAPGPGLGNLMFPIARALAGRARHGGSFIMPTMRQMKFGTFLRNEPDRRTYGGIFRGRTFPEFAERLAIMPGPSVAETEYNPARFPAGVVRYEGLRGYFHDIAPWRETLTQWFQKRAVISGGIAEPYDLAIHVRLGDFAPAQPGNRGPNLRLSAAWYLGALEQARELLQMKAPRTVLFTDARPQELDKIAQAAGATPDPGGNAITSILNMSRARLVIASRSTFSMWACFLGNTAALWDAGFDLAPFWPERPGRDHRHLLEGATDRASA